MIYDDDDGQIDGDSSGSVQFRPNTAQPWLRSGMPPWHLWGNTERLTVPFALFNNNIQPTTGQLIKISYKRPESWNWIFAARLISGPDAIASLHDVRIDFDLIVGIGRSALSLSRPLANNSISFETFNFTWGPLPNAFPSEQLIYTTEVLAPNRSWRSQVPFANTSGNAVPPEQSASTIRTIVAQDIQLSCRVTALTPGGDGDVGFPLVLDVSAHFAPVSHVRPDWYRRGPDELAFPGDEIEGR